MLRRPTLRESSVRFGVGSFNQLEPEINHLIENNDYYEPESISQTQLGVDMYTEMKLHVATRTPKYRDWDEDNKERTNRKVASDLLNAKQYGSRRGFDVSDDEDYREVSNKHYVGGIHTSVAERKRDGIRQHIQKRSLAKRPTRTKKTKDNQIYKANFIKDYNGVQNKRIHDPSYRRLVLGPDRHGVKYAERANPVRSIIDAANRIEFCRKGTLKNNETDEGSFVSEKPMNLKFVKPNVARVNEKLHDIGYVHLSETVRKTKRIKMPKRDRPACENNSELEAVEHKEFEKPLKLVPKIAKPNINDFVQGFSGSRYGIGNIGGFKDKPGQVAFTLTTVPRNLTKQPDSYDQVEYSLNGAVLSESRHKHRQKNRFVNPYNSNHVLQTQNQLKKEFYDNHETSNDPLDNELKMKKYMRDQESYNEQATVRGANYIDLGTPDYKLNKTQRKKQDRGIVIRHKKVADSKFEKPHVTEIEHMPKSVVVDRSFRHMGLIDSLPFEDVMEKRLRIAADTTNRRNQIETLNRIRMDEGMIFDDISHATSCNVNPKKVQMPRVMYNPDTYKSDLVLNRITPLVPKSKLPRMRKKSHVVKTHDVSEKVAYSYKVPLVPMGPRLKDRKRINTHVKNLGL